MSLSKLHSSRGHFLQDDELYLVSFLTIFLRRNICCHPHKNHHRHNHPYYCRRRRFCGAILQYMRTTSFASSLCFLAQFSWPCIYCLMADLLKSASTWTLCFLRSGGFSIFTGGIGKTCCEQQQQHGCWKMQQTPDLWLECWKMSTVFLIFTAPSTAPVELLSSTARANMTNAWSWIFRGSHRQIAQAENPALLFPTVAVWFHSAINNLPNWNVVIFFFFFLVGLIPRLLNFTSRRFGKHSHFHLHMWYKQAE